MFEKGTKIIKMQRKLFIENKHMSVFVLFPCSVYTPSIVEMEESHCQCISRKLKYHLYVKGVLSCDYKYCSLICLMKVWIL